MMFSEIINKKNLKGVLIVDKNFPFFLLFDQYRLTQILLNIVSNAAKFTPKGSIIMSVSWIKGPKEVTQECFAPYPFDQDEE